MPKMPKETIRNTNQPKPAAVPASAVRAHSLRLAFLECEPEAVDAVKDILACAVRGLRSDVRRMSDATGYTPDSRLRIRDALYTYRIQLNAFERAYALLFNEDPLTIT